MSGMGRQSIDDFLKSQNAPTITPPRPQSYIDSAMGAGQKSYIDSVMSQDQGQHRGLIPEVTQAPPPQGRDWAAIALGGMKAFKEMLVDQGKNLSQYSKYFNESYTSPEWFSGNLMQHERGTSQQADLALAAAGNVEAQERIRRGKEGEALAISTAAAEFTAAGIAARSLAQGVKAGVLKKGLAWLAAQEAGAGAYAATAPMAEGETRLEAFERAAWQFPATGAVLHGVMKGLGFALDRIVPKIDPKIAEPLKTATPAQAEDIGKRTEAYVRQVGPVPEAHAEDVAAEGMARATKDVMRLGMPTEEQMGRNYDALRSGKLEGVDQVTRSAALAEKMRGRPFTRVEFDSFVKDFGEDGPYMAMRKWAEPPGARRTGATAKAEVPTTEGEPDFTVEDLEPPPPPEPAVKPSEPPPVPRPRGGLRSNLGVPSEAELQQELETLVPKEKVPPDLEAEARARAEEARTTPFPEPKVGPTPDVPPVRPPGWVEPPPDVRPGGPRMAEPLGGRPDIQDVYSKPQGTYLKTIETDYPLGDIGITGLEDLKETLQGIRKIGRKNKIIPGSTPEDIANDLNAVERHLKNLREGGTKKDIPPGITSEPPMAAKGEPPEPPRYFNEATRAQLAALRATWAKTKSPQVREVKYRQIQRIFKSNWGEFRDRGLNPTYEFHQFMGTEPQSDIGLESKRAPGRSVEEAGAAWERLDPEARRMAFGKPDASEVVKAWSEHSPARQVRLAKAYTLATDKMERLLNGEPGLELMRQGGQTDYDPWSMDHIEKVATDYKNLLFGSPLVEAVPEYQVVSKSLPPETTTRIAASWYAADLTEALGKLNSQLWSRLRRLEVVARSKFGGLGLEPDYLGLNVNIPLLNDVLGGMGKARLPYNENLILYNPFTTLRELHGKEIPFGSELTDVLAEDTWHTMVHEVAHQAVRGETPEHVAMMKKIVAASEISKDIEVRALKKLWDQMTRDGMFVRHFMEVLDVWEQQRIPTTEPTGQGIDVPRAAKGGPPTGGDIQPPQAPVEDSGLGGAGLGGPVEPGGVEPGGSYRAVFGDSPYGGGDDLESLLAKKAHNPDLVPNSAIANAANEEAVKSLTPQEMLGPEEQVKAAEAVAELPHEPTQRQPLTYLRQVGDEPAGAEMDSEPGAKSDETLHTEQKKGEDFWRSEDGAVGRKAAVRIAMLGLSGMSEYAAEQTEDPDKKAYLRWVSRFLAFGVLAEAMGSKAMKAWVQRPIPLRTTGKTFAPLYAFIRSFDGPRIMTDGSVKAMDQWHAMTSWGRSGAEFMRKVLEPHFPDTITREAGMYSIDEGAAAPEWHTLSPQTQAEVLATNHLNGQMLSRMETVGAIPPGSGRAWYISKLFEDRETGAEWLSKWQNLVDYGAPGQAQAFATVREAVNWARTLGRDLPNMDPAKVQPHFTEEVTRQMANHTMVEGFRSTGVLVPFDRTRILNQNPHTPLMFRLRQVRVPGLGPPQMATDEAATLLERAHGSRDFGGALAAVDKARGVMMRSIMFWAWEHGINGSRAALALTMNPMKYLDSVKAVRALDPVMLEMSKFSNPYQRTDWGLQAQTEFDKVMEEATARFATKWPALGRIGASVEHWRAGWERHLWNEWIPAIGHLAWTQEMNAWTNRTGGRHLIGSPEYNAFAKRVGELADDAMGKVPKLLVDPRIAFMTRQALFSPNWTRTRIGISLKAGVEGVRIASGELEPKDALYLPFKLRSVLIGTALTAMGSLILTGIHALITGHGKPELPQFNPNTNKFYMRTGMYDRSNREIGFDMAGWYQDDVKMFNDPFAYLRDRQNPMLRTASSMLTGRDVFGRTIEGAGRVDQVLSGLGPPGEVITSAGKMIAGNREPGDLLRAATGVAAVGNVSALPTMADENANRLATRILQDQGLPTDKDRVYQLSLLIKRNVTQKAKPYSGDVMYWVASQNRQYQRTGFPWLWDQAKRDLRMMMNSK